jgi:hypothetical protein
MTNLFDVHKRPLPDFTQWLEQHAPGCRAPGFESFADLARRTQEQSLDNLKPHEASFARMWMGGCIAAVEMCNMEALKHKRPQSEIVANLVRVFATASIYAIASVCEADAPLRSIAKVVTEEFRAAAKIAADSLLEQNERSAR